MCDYKKLKEDIRKIRKTLDDMIESGADAERIYEVSRELDKMLVEVMRAEEK